MRRFLLRVIIITLAITWLTSWAIREYAGNLRTHITQERSL